MPKKKIEYHADVVQGPRTDEMRRFHFPMEREQA